MRIVAFILFAPLVFAGCASTAPADKVGGYLYVFATCMQETVSRPPRNVCEAPEEAEPKYVVITSNVIRSRNGRDTLGEFRSAARDQLNLTIEGRESAVLPTRRAAEDGLAESLASNRRIEGDGVVFATVALPED